MSALWSRSSTKFAKSRGLLALQVGLVFLEQEDCQALLEPTASPDVKASVVPAVPQAGVVPEAIQAIEDRPVKMVPTGTGVVVAFPANLALWVFPGALGLLERMGNLGCKAYLELLDVTPPPLPYLLALP